MRDDGRARQGCFFRDSPLSTRRKIVWPRNDVLNDEAFNTRGSPNDDRKEAETREAQKEAGQSRRRIQGCIAVVSSCAPKAVARHCLYERRVM
jgi:hypothetical protein